MRERAMGMMTAVVCSVLCGPAAGAAEPASTEGKPRLLSVAKIWDAGAHNAFTDLIRFQDAFFCTFREAEDHVGGDGLIRVLRSENGETWKSVAGVTEQGTDLRDPKLSITPDGRLMLTMGGSIYNGTKTLMGRQPRVAFSPNGSDWTKPERVLEEGDWLWRVTWHDGKAYGVAYRVTPREDAENENWLASLYVSDDGVDYKRVCDLQVPDRAGETTLRFLPGGDMLALVRREKGSQNGWIGKSSAPYTEWSWHETEHRLGGPNFIILPSGDIWAGSRSYPGGAKTVLVKMTAESYEPVLTLPSGGDTSYPGFVWHAGLLWMSYYASHEGKTSIYLAKIRLPEN